MEDQRWTLARVTRLIFELFRVRYTPRGVSYLLHRIGWTPQVPQHVAAERDEDKVATWVKETCTAARLKAWICFQDEAGQSLRPPKARTWSRRGHTPKVLVSGKGSGRVNLAGMIAVRPGCRTRLIYRAIAYHGRKMEKKGFHERDLAGMLDAAYQQFGRANIVLVWDNDTSHRDAAMKKLIAERD